MITVIVKKPFKRRGEIITVGTVMAIPDEAMEALGDHVKQITLQNYVGEFLAETDRRGRPWPSRFVADMPAEARTRLRELESEIDAAVLCNNDDAAQAMLTEWRRLLLSRLH